MDSDILEQPDYLTFITGDDFFNFEQFQQIDSTVQDIPQVRTPFLEIINQPCRRFRFRYESEKNNFHRLLAGESGPGTYPTVRLYNFHRPAIIRCVVCRSEKENYKLHCHTFMMKNRNNHMPDPFYVPVVDRNDFTAVFKGGLIFTPRREVAKILKNKLNSVIEKHKKPGQNLAKTEKINLGIDDIRNINTNKVVLRFDAYELVDGNEYVQICDPVFSTPILNQKSAETGSLKIVRLNKVMGSCLGGEEIFLLVEKVTKEVKVRFFDNEGWEAFGSFNSSDVHHQYVIVVKSPPYKNVHLDSPVKVHLELVRYSDSEDRSEPRDFIYMPENRRFLLNIPDSDTE